MSKHFCCCIPVRFGVFILSLLTLLGSAVAAGATWWLLINGPQHGVPVQGGVKTGLIIAAAVFTVFALFGLFGFIGAIIRSRGLVRTYGFFLWIQLLISVAMGIVWVVVFFKDDFRLTLLNTCAQQLNELKKSSLSSTAVASSSLEFQETCSRIFNQSRTGVIVSYSVNILINLYCCIIVHLYGAQLTEEQQYKSSSHAMGQTYAAKDAPQGYYPHTPLANAAGRQGHYEYPYAQKEHGFGATSH